MQLKLTSLAGELFKTALTLGLGPLSVITSTSAMAESAPVDGYLSFRVLNYQDSQPDLERIAVRAPALGLLLPLGDAFALEASVLQDTISGASPAYHAVKASAKTMLDRREAADLRLTHYLPSGSLAISAAYSKESDYLSRALSFSVSQHTESKNTTLALGVGHTQDEINPINNLVVDAYKSVNDVLIGVTQIWTPVDIVQLNLTWSYGKGYFSDPYKLLDKRPAERRSSAALLRWNHRFDDLQSTMRLGYRYYHDSYAIGSSTVTVEWAQDIQGDWTLAPLLRVYRQSAASFYIPPDPTAPGSIQIPEGFILGESGLSFDQRLSAFDATTWGLKVAKKIDAVWTVEARWERYRQRSAETPFDATFSQLALTRSF